MGAAALDAAGFLIHPSAVVGVAFFVGVDVAALVVEADVAVLLTHVDLELARASPPLPTIVVVTETENTFTESGGHSPPRCPPRKQEAKERAAQDNEISKR